MLVIEQLHAAPTGIEVERFAEPELPIACRYEIAVVLIEATTGGEALHRFEANDDRIGTVIDEVRAAGYGVRWGIHESFVTDREESEF